MRQFTLFIVAFLGLLGSAFATHNRAGEISYRKVVPDDPNDFKYEITVVTCTKASSQADRPFLNVRFGDEPLGAPVDSIARVDADPPVGNIPPDDARINRYTVIHTYPGPGSYVISMEDPNRNGGVINMDESISQVFYIESLLIISAFGGHNNSVKLLYPAKDEACINAFWEHNPGAYDVDGDSLSYSLVACRGLEGNVILSWELPNMIDETVNVDDSFTINPLTGTIAWVDPVIAGEYNIAIKISEFRNGILVGYVIRDMQVSVRNCANEPPIVSIVEDTCVVAGGDPLVFTVSAYDLSSQVDLQAVGAPMTELTNLATFTTINEVDTVIGTFTWSPQCEEVRPGSYQMLFVGEDRGSFNTDLVDIMEVNITVVAPPVENFTVETNGLSFDLNWDTHLCDETIAYKVYKRNGEFGFIPGPCETGVPAYTGYELLTTVIAPDITYNDAEDIDFGTESCYMIVACLANGSESIASNEICNSIDLIIPVITKVSVGITDITNGKDTINWAPPVTEDTLLLTTPFLYRLYHGAGFNEAENLIFESATSQFISDLPRQFIHNGINTVDTPNSYRVELVDADGAILSSKPSSSLFISIAPDDNQLTISWESNTSWENTDFDIFKLNDLSGTFEYLASTQEAFYTDIGLVNNVDYCYYVRALGTFNSSLDVLPDPTINLSQELCAFPVDLTAPCAPTLVGIADCETATVSLSWNNPNESCTDDVTEYRIYYKPFLDSEYELLETISNPEETNYEYINEANITGCFYVTALDSILPGLGGIPNQNESVASLEICSENCPEYMLPNVFSPQGDGFNDLFRPFPYKFVDSIDLTIFNRWGAPVFKTIDPDINWNGTNKDSGEISSDGVYFYEITIYTSKLTGVIEEKRSGNIVLLDGEKQPTN